MRNDSPALLLPRGLPSIYERGEAAEHEGPADPESNEVERRLQQFLTPIYSGALPGVVRSHARMLGDVTSGVRSSSPWMYALASTGVDESTTCQGALTVPGEMRSPMSGLTATTDPWCEDFDTLDWGRAREAIDSTHHGSVVVDLCGSLSSLVVCAEQLAADLDTLDPGQMREAVAAMQVGTVRLQCLLDSLVTTRTVHRYLVGDHFNLGVMSRNEKPAPSEAPYAPALQWLEGIIGLNKTEIANLLGVKRQTLYNWQDPIRPWPRHVERLFKIKEILERAHENHSQPGEVKTWLLTPRRSDGMTPFDLIRGGRLDEARYAAVVRPSARLAEPLHRPARRPNHMYRSGDDLARQADALQPDGSTSEEPDPHLAN